MKNYVLFIAGLVLGALTGWFGALFQNGSRNWDLKSSSVVCDTIVMRDTVRVNEPKLVQISHLSPQRKRLPLAVDKDCGDSVEVELEMERKVYADSSYSAWVSGYSVNLDSIEIYPIRTMVNRVETIAVDPACDKRRWGVALAAGVGLTPRGVQPFIGFAVSYDLRF